MPDTDLPTDVLSGKVVARLIKTVADAGDPGALPDEIVIEGTVKFSPRVTVYKNPNPNLAVVVPGIVVCDIDSEGYLVSNGERGVWLPEGAYRVTYRLLNARIRTHLIVVLPEHTDENPLNLVGSIPPAGPVGTSGEYASLSARIDALNGVSTDDPRLSDARPPTAHNHDDRYFTEGEIEAKLADIPTTQDLENESTARQTAVSEVWDTLNEEVSARSAADDGFNVRIELLEEGTVDLSDYVTDGEMATALSGKANTSHSHTSAAITDFREAVEDAMAATLVGAGVTITHEDGSDTITLTGVAGADAEGVRDAIGAALVGVGPISIVPNDSGDTIVITVSATVNSTDAALRDRSTHTGLQTISTVNGLQAALDNKAATTDPPVSHGNSHKKDTGSDPITPADIGAATAAQGAKADTAVQPAALSAYSTTAHTHTTSQVTDFNSAVAALIASAAGTGGKWRGTWSSVSLLKAYDPIVDGLSVGTLTVVNVSPPMAVLAKSSCPILTGDVPIASNIYQISKQVPGGSAPYGAYSVQWDITAPAGSSQVRFKHAFAVGGGGYGNAYVQVNGVTKRNIGEVNAAWLAFNETIAPGQILRVVSYAPFNGAGAAYIGDLEFWGAAAPYAVGDLVYYSGKFWSCASSGTTATPGADGTWTDLNIVVDLTDLTGSSAIGRSLLAAADQAAVQTIVGASGGGGSVAAHKATHALGGSDALSAADIGAAPIGSDFFRGAWEPTRSYLLGEEVQSGGQVWIATAPNTNTLPTDLATPVQTGSDGGPGSYSITASLGISQKQLAHPIRLNAAALVGGFRITQHNATAPPAQIEVTVLSALPTGSSFTPSFATTTATPVSVGSNRYDLYLDDPIPLLANTNYWVWIRAVTQASFTDMNGQLGGSYSYSGISVANTATTTVSVRNDGGTWSEAAAGRHIYMGILTVTPTSWSRIGVNLDSTVVGRNVLNAATAAAARSAIGAAADAASGGPSGNLLLVDFGATPPAGTPSGTVVIEKAGTLTTWDFTGAALPAGWTARGGATASFAAGTGATLTCPSAGGFSINMTSLPAECVVEMHALSQASNSSVMFGVEMHSAAGDGAQSNWYASPNGLLTTGMTAFAYNSNYNYGGPAPVSPFRFRLHKNGTTYTSQVSLDGGVSWTADLGAITVSAVVTQIGVGCSLGTTSAVIQRVTYRPGPPVGSSGRVKGWWDGSAIQSVA